MHNLVALLQFMFFVMFAYMNKLSLNQFVLLYFIASITGILYAELFKRR